HREEALRQAGVDAETRGDRADEVEVDVVMDVLAGAGDVLEALHKRLLPGVVRYRQHRLDDLVDRRLPPDASRWEAREQLVESHGRVHRAGRARLPERRAGGAGKAAGAVHIVGARLARCWSDVGDRHAGERSDAE